ncbi:MAG: type IV secretion system protein [Candidatus Colwellbacteria bacterium]|nr:type IV secretion system protein [Candidatus Colwellbacteria bacterium]
MSSAIKPSQSPRFLTATFIALALFVAMSPLFAKEALAKFQCFDVTGFALFLGTCFSTQAECEAGASGVSCAVEGFGFGKCKNVPDDKACKVEGLPKIGGDVLKGAGSALFDITVGFVLKFLNYLLYAISTVLERLVALSAFLLEMAIDVSSAPFSDITILQNGWKIVRDVMNSFFVLILFIIAIATILQLESYAWKQLLPWFIIIALLVNFSFVLSGVVIDFSNVLGRTFFDKMQPLKDNIAKAFNINNIDNIQFGSCAPPSPATSGATGAITKYSTPWWCTAATDAGNLAIEWKKVWEVPSSEHEQLAKILFLSFLRVTMLFLMIFPLLAGAALMIVRTVMLMVLIIFAPAAFAAYILPATRSYTNQWYTQLFSLSFFFPSYMFLLYIAIKYGIGIGEALKATGGNLGGTFSNLATIFNFLTMVAFMFIALSVGRKSGIYGAEIVVKTAGDARKWATGYAGRMTGVPRLSEKLAESGAAQRFAARFPTLGGATLRTLQKGATLGGREAAIKREVDTAMKLAPRYQATAYLKASKPVRRKLEEQMKAEGLAEVMHYTDDKKTRQKIRDAAFAYMPPEQRKDSQEKLKTAYADREANRQSTGQLVGRFDSNYYTQAEEEKIFDEAKTDRRAKILLRSTRNIAELALKWIPIPWWRNLTSCQRRQIENFMI